MTHLNRFQFYSALKLVAAHQANISIRPEVLTTNLDLPLPRLTLPHSDTHSPIPDLIELRTNDLNEYKEHVNDLTSTDSEIDSETLSVGQNGSPAASSAASDSPTPTNSVQDRNWMDFGIAYEEQRQLLGK